MKVGVIAVDPTSPFSGGAVLGDRVRMNAHAGDSGVFIRSMATRGHLGGLARATSDAALVLDAAGADVVIIETVGVGQDEVDIVSAADISIVLLVPGAGDELQAIKAGVMEIGDIFVVNKADREGADRVVQAVASNLSLKTYDSSEWKPPILKTEATAGAGIDVLWKEIGRFKEWARAHRQSRRRQRHESRLRELLAFSFLRRVDGALSREDFDRYIEAVASRARDPYSVVEEIMSRIPSPGSRIPG
jgi:LAO/AO transport system kinase